MIHANEEVEEFVALSQALVINLGTLSKPWIKSMRWGSPFLPKRWILPMRACNSNLDAWRT